MVPAGADTCKVFLLFNGCCRVRYFGRRMSWNCYLFWKDLGAIRVQVSRLSVPAAGTTSIFGFPQRLYIESLTAGMRLRRSSVSPPKPVECLAKLQTKRTFYSAHVTVFCRYIFILSCVCIILCCILFCYST